MIANHTANYKALEGRQMFKADIITYIHENRCSGYAYDESGRLINEHRIPGPFKPNAIIHYVVSNNSHYVTVTRVDLMHDTRPSYIRY